MDDLVKSSARTLDILKLISEYPDDLTLSDISHTTNIPLSSLHALVHTMVEKEYLVRDEHSLRYAFGPGFARLVTSFASNIDLVSLADPVIDKMRCGCEEGISMSILDGDMIRFIHFRHATSMVQVVNTIGSHLPAHATGSGQVMLAYLPDEEVDRLYPDEQLPRTTQNTITSRSELKRTLKAVRLQGYAIDNEESESGIWAIAGCIRNPDGKPMAAISIVAPTTRVHEELIPIWTKLITESATELSAKIRLVPVKH